MDMKPSESVAISQVTVKSALQKFQERNRDNRESGYSKIVYIIERFIHGNTKPKARDLSQFREAGDIGLGFVLIALLGPPAAIYRLYHRFWYGQWFRE